MKILTEQHHARVFFVGFWSGVLVMFALAFASPQALVPIAGWDVFNHSLGFALLTVLGVYAHPTRIFMLLVGLVVYGAFIEILQSFTVHRFAEWTDFGADGLGVLGGYMLFRLLRARK